MTTDVLLPFLAIAAIAGYFQTVTGFGLGMILIGLTSSLDIVPIAATATIVSFLLLVNSVVALPGRCHAIEWPIVGSIALGVVPAMLVGLVLLEYLDDHTAGVLRAALGLLLVYGAFDLMRTPKRRGEASIQSGFFVSGLVSGLCGGLFGIPGPPLVYQLFRQPLALAAIRNMLILILALVAGFRALMVWIQGGVDAWIVLLTASTVPVIAASTWLGRHYPPPLTTRYIRWVAGAVLFGIGVALIGAQLWSR